MAKITVLLDEIICTDTEDVTGADGFYVAGAVKTPDGQTSKGFVTRPLNINNGQTMKFGPGGGYVFDGLIPDNGVFQIEMVAFDEDAAKDWQRYDQAKTLLDQALSSTPNPYSYVGSIAVDALSMFMQLDQDDELGQKMQPFSIAQMPSGWTFHQWNIRGGSTFFSNWDYWVRYWVGKF